MDTHSIQVLEYGKVMNLVSRYAVSVVGSKRVLEFQPIDDIENIRTRQKLISEAILIIDSGEAVPLCPLDDLSPLIDKASISGSVLDEKSLLEIAKLAKASRHARTFFEKKRPQVPSLWGKISDLADLKDLEREIEDAIDADGSVKDTASDRLRQIRRQKIRLSEKIRSVLEGIIASNTSRIYLQDEIITIRNGRYVIPVRSDSRGRIAGIVHDTSQTGATVFIEPLKTVELNNNLRNLDVEEKEEILRILRFLTSWISRVADDLREALDRISFVDAIFACARFAKDFGCSSPVVSDQPGLKLRNARHPILVEMFRRGDIQKVVPLDIDVTHKGVIITGPNAGGKTVALKTIGLLVLLSKVGLHIPCGDGTEIGFFDNVFADIGDEQSIEMNLSTFSSHMGNIVRILKNAGSRSLVLLDEIGAGTDPSEGAALARSIIEELIGRGAVVVATTHQSDLKVFAYENPELENASMEFDEVRMAPTYRLVVGVPGASHAFEIANRIGMPEHLLGRAREYIGEERVRLEDLSRDLSLRIRALEEEKEGIEIEKRKVRSMTEEYEKKIAGLKAEEKEKRKEALLKARSIVESARRMIAEIMESVKRSTPTLPEIRQVAKRIGEEYQKIDEAIKEIEEPPQRKHLDRVRVGEKAFVVPFGRDCVILSEPDKDGKVEVAVGNIRAEVSLDDLCAPCERKVDSESISHAEFKPKQVPMEIDVRGLTADEAWAEAERYLDDAALYGYDWVRIIHGKGKGILANKIWEMLASHPAVRNYRFAEMGQGGTGVTIVDLGKG